MKILDLRVAARAIAPEVVADPATREAALHTWRGRMVNEHGSAPVFLALADQLADAGAPAAQIEAVRAMADEERAHGVLCGSVVEALGGEALAPALPEEPLPVHADVDRFEAVTRNLLSVCCLSETVAVALIGAERLEMPAGPLQDVLTRILADEVGHARLGWKWLAEHQDRLDAPRRARLGRYLAVAFAHLEAHELAQLKPGGPVDPRLGVCDGAAARALFYATVETVIVPRLDALGLPARQAWAERAAA
ncbi:MAG: ferritin-like domain-containing protein [Myxococcales bacterium]|nr:ferritin-like domain-containing protein [Myxococcales bacterium]MCB9546936.1 ferritin-like domain-containing protein [Myxococcales bacterium]